VVTGGADGRLRCYDAHTGRAGFTLEGPGGPVQAVAVSPDGRLLAAGDGPRKPGDPADGTIRVWEWASRKEVLHFAPEAGPVKGLAFAADGRLLVSHAGMTALVWDLAPADAVAADPAAAQRQAEALWEQLAGDDAAAAYRAACTLAASPERAVALLGQRLKPATASLAERIEQALKDLDDDDFKVREAASAVLRGLGAAAVPALRRTLEGKPSPEVRARAEKLLAQLDDDPPPGGPALRTPRAIQVLERIGTPAARRVLEDLARGAADAPETQDAKASLRRLARQPAGGR
jgi:hypothetical protein